MKLEICDEFYYKIKDLNENIYEMFNTSKENVFRNNEKIKFYEGEWVKIKVNDYVCHHVKPMENLVQIASKYDKDVEDIIIDNHLNDKKVFIGQVLKIYNSKKVCK